MKTIICLLFLIAIGTQIKADEVSLYDSKGNAVAYVDTGDENTIYTWAGNPVAYISKDSVYSFDGKHLGWLSKGVIRNHDGDAVGFIKGAITNVTLQLENLKGLKQLKPLKGLPELEPLKPLWTTSFSATPLSLFLSTTDN